MSLPETIERGATVYYAAEDGRFVTEFRFSHFVPSGTKYAHMTTGHQPPTARCYLTRKEAVAACVKKLRSLIRELESTVH